MTVDLEEFRRYLAIDKTSIDDELMQHPSLYYTISEALVEATARRDAIKDDLAKTEAALDRELRAEFEVSGDKFTESQIKNLILLDEERTKVNQQFLTAKSEADLLTALKESFHQRGYMLRDLASLYVSNYYQNDSVRVTQTTDDAVYNRRRARLAEGRKKRGE